MHRLLSMALALLLAGTDGSLLSRMGFSWTPEGSPSVAAEVLTKRRQRLPVVAAGALPNPIVLVPGLFGSQIEANLKHAKKPKIMCKKNLDWFLLWLDIGEMLPPTIDCFWNHITMQILPNGSSVNLDGIETRVPDYGGVEAVRCAIPSHCNGTKSMYDLLDVLEGSGYRAGLDLRAAPFDWRTGPEEWASFDFPRLKALIEETVAKNGGRKVSLVSLSLGGPYTQLFLTTFITDAAWKDAHVENWVSLSGLWNGVTLSAHMLTAGYTSSVFPPWLTWIDPAVEKLAVRTMPGVPYLLPAPVSLANGSVVDDVVVSIAGTDYKASQMPQVLELAGANATVALFNRTQALRAKLLHPGVTTFCWHGSNLSTEVALDFNSTDLSQQPALRNGNGDGTVPMKSLQLCKQWPADDAHPVHEEGFANVGHLGMVTNPDVLARILDVVMGNATFPPEPPQPYFANPFAGPCRNDELNTSIAGDLYACSPACVGKHSKSCPTAVFPNVTAAPECSLDSFTNVKQCALNCKADDECGAGGTCHIVHFPPAPPFPGEDVGTCGYSFTNTTQLRAH